jgi:hypothetical protein
VDAGAAARTERWSRWHGPTEWRSNLAKIRGKSTAQRLMPSGPRANSWRWKLAPTSKLRERDWDRVRSTESTESHVARFGTLWQEKRSRLLIRYAPSFDARSIQKRICIDRPSATEDPTLVRPFPKSSRARKARGQPGAVSSGFFQRNSSAHTALFRVNHRDKSVVFQPRTGTLCTTSFPLSTFSVPWKRH